MLLAQFGVTKRMGRRQRNAHAGDGVMMFMGMNGTEKQILLRLHPSPRKNGGRYGGKI